MSEGGRVHVNISLEEFVVVRRWQHELREFCPQILPTTECANISMAFYPSRNPLLIISKAARLLRQQGQLMPNKHLDAFNFGGWEQH
ncbi:predicted protein [Histoplasma mississippiense (nom. inval.)]|uniref:predicted protein n=1 Tax=Ajellomyces capsulatus (strain NAm1 / WU24) TaxID=2059318 RepID=UPI000157B7E2|nr:predicted protein [Histoplasma mississippiense (nom. inval.)]EDN03706.1 predicted protein [Histoplasma mississippiense (nom. inval.)]